MYIGMVTSLDIVAFKLKHSASLPHSASERLSHKRTPVFRSQKRARSPMGEKGQKRIFAAATNKVGQKSEGSGSASLMGHMAYGGSRRKVQRWEYSEDTGAGFAELAPDKVPTEEEFFEMLRQVPGVTRVWKNTTKTSQGNPSKGHHMEQNLFVASRFGPGSESNPIEFELTRNRHMKDPRCPFTVTACFKEPTPDLIPEAWRILVQVVKGRELLPQHVAQYREKVLKRWQNKELNCQLQQRQSGKKQRHVEQPGSASNADVPPSIDLTLEDEDLGQYAKMSKSIAPPASTSGPDVPPALGPNTEAVPPHLGPNTSGEAMDVEPPGSASGLDVLLEPGPNTSGAVGQDATEAQLPDENAMKNLRSQALPGSASSSDQHPNCQALPGSASSSETDWGSCLEDLEMSNDFHLEVGKPVSGSSEASLEQALLLQDAREEKC